MKKLKIGIIDLAISGPVHTMWARVMHANLSSVMPQVVATWCEQEGHDVKIICYTGFEDLSKELPQDVDLVFICSFTHAALLAYVNSISDLQKPILHETMEANFMYNLSLIDFARMTQRSLASFKRDFIEIYHTSPGKWLAQKKLEYAMLLLNTSKKNGNSFKV